MPIVIVFGIIFLLVWQGRKGRDIENNEKQAKLTDTEKADSEYQQKLDQADELITIILPTINHPN